MRRALVAPTTLLVGLAACQTTAKAPTTATVATKTVAAHNAPAARSMHTALWTGQGMVIWGGVLENPSAVSDYVTGGAIYYPKSKKWLALPQPDQVQVSRYHHSAIWTGRNMIIWGGVANGTRMNDGLMLDIQDEKWYPVSGDKAPAPRSGHSAVWTGDVMLVWGGEGDEDKTYGDGGRYDLVNDKWDAVPADPGIAPRSFHTAVWTGKKMIVWGGIGVDGKPLQTGGIYDPKTKTWTAMSVENAPKGRFSHSVVWTGKRMIVWGGRSSSDGDETGAYLGDGGSYDPATDTWSKISAAGAPAPRELHTAIWTGDAMVVWGGNNSTKNFADGGFYNPVTDRWERLKTKAKTPPRSMAAAVWTGNSMIVWGGRSSASEYIKAKTGLIIPIVDPPTANADDN